MKKDNNKILALIWYVCAVLDYITATIGFVSENRTLAVIWLCLGSTALCIGSTYINKMKKDNNSQDK